MSGPDDHGTLPMFKAVPTDPMIGRRIGGYRIARLLGAGGMGAVYVAEHSLALGTRMAVKVLLPEIAAKPQALDRFLTEARAAVAVDHDAVVEVWDLALFPEDGRAYFTMPLLDGEDLEDHVARAGRAFGHEGRVPVEDAWRLLAAPVAALRAAHEKGIVHRDIKLSNLFVIRAPRGFAVKVLDFGIAKLLADDAPLLVGARTDSRAVVGTPGFMAPEQGLSPKDVDRRADIYAVGVIAYRILTGRMPFDAETIVDLLFKQKHTTPPRPRALVPEIPAELDELIMRSLAADPADRPQDMHEVALGWADAVPNGRQIAEAVGLLEKATPTERTVPTPGRISSASSPSYGSIPREVPITGAPAAWPVSGQAAGAVSMSTASSPALGGRWRPAAVVAAVTLAATAVVVALSLGLGSGNTARSEIAADAGHDTSTGAVAASSVIVLGDASDSAVTSNGADAAIAPPDASTKPPDGGPLEDAPVAPLPSVAAPSRRPDPAARSEPPARPGTIAVLATPWADVTVDGKFAGTAPVTVTVAAGKHTVQLDHRGGREMVKVTVKPGRNVTITRSWE